MVSRRILLTMTVTSAECRSQGCRDWVAAGRPWTLAPSMRALQLTVGGHGFTVYAFPDDSHLTASTPEDHTSFSATGWPGAAPRWYGNADDIMPRNGDLAELERLAQQIIADKDAGIPGTEFLKYINWTESNGTCWHTSWQSTKVTKSSSDKGHIHLSGRSDWATRAAIPYDPVARMNGVINVAGVLLDESQWRPVANTHDRLFKLVSETMPALIALVKTVLAKVDIDAAELDAIEAAAKAGAAGALAANVDAWAQAVAVKLAAIGVGSAATHDEMVTAIREVFLDAGQK